MWRFFIRLFNSSKQAPENKKLTEFLVNNHLFKVAAKVVHEKGSNCKQGLWKTVNKIIDEEESGVQKKSHKFIDNNKNNNKL